MPTNLKPLSPRRRRSNPRRSISQRSNRRRSNSSLLIVALLCAAVLSGATVRPAGAQRTTPQGSNGSRRASTARAANAQGRRAAARRGRSAADARSAAAADARSAASTSKADERAAIARISADDLRGHLSFIASDALEGRNTPSRGLDLAAEYIAAQFRRAGLEAVGDDGYFQTAKWSVRERNLEGFALSIQTGERTFAFDPAHVSLTIETGSRPLFPVDTALEVSRAPVLLLDYRDTAALAALTPEQVAGRVVLTELPDFRREERSRWREIVGDETKFLSRLGALRAALVLSVDRFNAKGTAGGSGRLHDPQSPPPATVATLAQSNATSAAPLITLHGADAAALYDGLKNSQATQAGQAGQTSAIASLHLAAPVEREARVRNVVGLLRGSDAALKETYVIVSAHYDHLGMLAGEGAGDRVYNGANDDGSGTVSVVELASALATLRPHPRRSILFMTFFGEEKGLLGSRYYGAHPIFPIERTVAQINLEQIGRTDDSEGAQVSSATVTGYDYTNIGAIIKAAGDASGVRVYKHPQNSDAFFGRSDNQSLADQGVPAHTVGVAFEFPDYHALGDEWQKVDYANMEKVDRMIAAAVLSIANNPQEPKWNEADPKTARYVQAWRAHHGK